ncbi:hypothetical protein GCM10010123_22260 [Pilimelia anulata]|uniref:PDZ domain-containing protein n=2 Tax=Pilimelia anulata TaxID=53371 RepID=A0A8J3B3M4_9ACTN|nr:hypothetical protein GCM10010123_22260 [Pilimelia anulata]
MTHVDRGDPMPPAWSPPPGAPAPAPFAPGVTSATPPPAGPVAAPAPPAAERAWWWSDGPADPWRDPAAPAAVVLPAPAPAIPPPPPAAEGPAEWRGTVRTFALVVIAVGLLAGLVGGALGFLAARRADGPLLGDRTPADPPAGVAATVAAVRPSVVQLQVVDAAGSSVGSGFVVSTAGHVLTNQHVLGGSRGPVQVTLPGGGVTAARLVGSDAEADLAVLKLDSAAGVRPARLGDSDRLAVGEQVLAFGSPLSLRETVTAGIVSALDRPLRTGGEPGEQVRYYAAIQTDAAVNQGNSGGPLVDAAGRVVGVNAVIQSVAGSREDAGNIGLAFAIPINQAHRIAREIIAHGRAKRTVLGAEVADAERVTGGARLGEVPAGGPAAAAGLRTGDVVTGIDGRILETSVDLIALVRKRAPGDAVRLAYQRGAQRRTVSVRLAADAR